MKTIPLHDFDEANRAEAAKNMKRYHFFLSPLTGSPFLRNEKLFVKAKNNPRLKLYYHLERPPLYFISMILSTNILGENELAYRLPSFIFGIIPLLIFLILAFIGNYFIPLLAFITNFDWWLSSQSALMDTMLSAFLFIAFLTFIIYLKKRKTILLFLSALSYGLAILSKGQPAAIFIFPIIFSFFTKKITLREIIFFLLVVLLTIFPYLFLVIKKFGWENFYNNFIGFAHNKISVSDNSQKAPFYWYFRWWMESFRVGLVLFFSLFLFDVYKKKLNYEKIITLFYFIFSFILISFSKNKVFWYVLPLIPIACFYIYLSLPEGKLINIALIILISSLPIFYGESNKIVIIYGVFLIMVSFFILNQKINIKNSLFKNLIITFSIIFPLIIFLKNFPSVQPTYPENKIIGAYYKKISQPKCLYIYKMPYESILFYSDSEEINYFGKKTQYDFECQNFLITSEKLKQPNWEKIYQYQRLSLYQLRSKKNSN